MWTAPTGATGTGSRVVRSLLQLSERWPCHIWLIDRMKFASLEANSGGGWGLLVYPILFSSPEPKAQGELIVWDSSRRPSECASVHTFKHEYL